MDTMEISTAVIDTPDNPSNVIEQPPDSPTHIHVTPERCIRELKATDFDDVTAADSGVNYYVHPPVILPSPPLSNQSLPIELPPPPPQPPDPLAGKVDPELLQWYRSTSIFKR
jgi:hypothetical protein